MSRLRGAVKWFGLDIGLGLGIPLTSAETHAEADAVAVAAGDGDDLVTSSGRVESSAVAAANSAAVSVEVRETARLEVSVPFANGSTTERPSSAPNWSTRSTPFPSNAPGLTSHAPAASDSAAAAPIGPIPRSTMNRTCNV